VIIVTDTNVLVSGLIKAYSTSAAIIRLILEGKIKLAYDLRIINEYRDVLNRNKFRFSSEQVEVILKQITEEGININAAPLKESLPDIDDNLFLEVAITGSVKFLVTGNKKHFPQEICKGVKILSPSEFISLFSLK